MKAVNGCEVNYMRLSVTKHCNIRCRYCMPEKATCEENPESMLTEDEMLTAVSAAATLGVNKVRITGGEPLVKSNILSICEKTADISGINELCITTNGTLLSRYAGDLRNAGVNRINISLDTLRADRYRFITRCGELNDALKGIDFAVEAGFDKVKINTVLIGGFNDDEITDIANLTRKYPVDVRFIELMPMYDGGDFDATSYISTDKVLDKLQDAVMLGGSDDVAKLYSLPGALGNIGLISPISRPFCSTCNRIRVTADGKVKPCLHSPDEYNIKGLSRTEMVDVMKEAILNKPKWHGELSCIERSRALRDMNEIGG